jgi:hypothetical protein
MKWFRWYRGTAERAKFRVIAKQASNTGMGGGTVHPDRVDGAVFLTDVLAVWVTLLEDAGNASHWGYVTRNATYIATLLDVGVTEVQAIIDGMIAEEMLEVVKKGNGACRYHIVNWEKYQHFSDTDPTAPVRQKRYRDKRKRNALLTGTDTDTDTEKKDSVAKATDAEPASDPRTTLFRSGLETLARITGKTPNSCRSLVGRWLADVSDEAIHVLGAIEEADRNRVADPVAWITRALKPKQRSFGQPSSAAADRKEATRQKWDQVCERLREYSQETGGGSSGSVVPLISRPRVRGP